MLKINKKYIIYAVTQLGTNTLMYIDNGYSLNLQFNNNNNNNIRIV